MTAIHDDLRTVLDAVAIESPVRYTLRGEPRDLPPPAGGDPEAEEGSALRAMLESDLYARLYTRPGPAPSAANDPLAQRDLVAALSAANSGHGTWEPRWRIGEVDEDRRVAVVKDGLTFWVETDGLRPRDGEIVQGEFCRVRLAKEIRGLMPGFYVAIGDGDEDDRRDDAEPLVRLYWHLTPGAAVAYMAAATECLNAAGVPFRTKVLNDPASYCRADAGVLYLGRRYYRRAAGTIARLHEAVAGGLRPDVPLFAKRLAPGLGLAEDPSNGMSFGQHRCHLAARALWGSYRRGDPDGDARGATLAATFHEAGLDPERPYLEPRSADGYAFGSPAPGARSPLRRRKSTRSRGAPRP